MRRLDFGTTHAYQGTVKINGQERTKCFSDKRCGGKETAMFMAIAWQNNNKPIRQKKEAKHSGPMKKSNTGIVGLTVFTKIHRSGNKSDYMQIHWSENGKRFLAMRSIEVHTYDGAKRELLAIRQKNHKPKKRNSV